MDREEIIKLLQERGIAFSPNESTDSLFTRLLSDEKGLVHREFRIDEVREEEREIELSFSSEKEVDRFGFVEVLEHGKDSVVLDRLNDGAPLLFNHNANEYLGTIKQARVDADNKGRAVVRFGKGGRANEIFEDIKDGILSKVSVGYSIDEYREERKKNKDYIFVTRWTPFEISIVTLPADNSVGLGRSVNRKNLTKSKMNREQIITALRALGAQFNENASDAELSKQLRSLTADDGGNVPEGGQGHRGISQIHVVQDEPSAADERARVKNIMQAGRKYKLTDLAEKAIEDGKSFEDFRAEAIEAIDKRQNTFTESNEPIGLSEREVKQFSLLRALRHLADPADARIREQAAFELEVSAAAAEKMKHRSDKGGLVVPIDVLRQPLQRDVVSFGGGSGYTANGSNLVDTTLLTSSFVELLRNRTVGMQLGTAIGGLVGNVDVPKQTAGSSGYWIGEDEEAGQEDIDFGSSAMDPHTAAAYGEITRRMLQQSSLDVEALFRADLIAALSQTIDAAIFYGDGSANSPIGIKHTGGVNSKDFANVNPTFSELVAMETACDLDNALQENSAYVADAGFRGHAKTSLKFDGVAGTIWEPGNTVNGYRTEISNQIAAGDVFFGGFGLDLIIGMWGGLEVTLDPYTHSARGRLRIVTMQDVDVLVRRPESFAYGVKPA